MACCGLGDARRERRFPPWLAWLAVLLLVMGGAILIMPGLMG